MTWNDKPSFFLNKTSTIFENNFENSWYWAEALAAQDEDAPLKEKFSALATELKGKQDEIEKLKLEATVVITEKFALDKELKRIDQLYQKSVKDFREQRI